MFGLFLSLQAKRNPLFPQLPARDEGFATMIKIDHFNPFASFAPTIKYPLFRLGEGRGRGTMERRRRSSSRPWSSSTFSPSSFLSGDRSTRWYLIWSVVKVKIIIILLQVSEDHDWEGERVVMTDRYLVFLYLLLLQFCIWYFCIYPNYDPLWPGKARPTSEESPP